MKFTPKFKKTTYRILVIVIIGIFGIFFLNFFQKEVRNFVFKISEPIQKIFWRAGNGVSDFFETISKIQNLKKENEKLKLKVQELLAQLISLKEIKKENQRLREALDIGLGKEFKLSLAWVIGKDISQDFILINKGADDGIVKGLPVISEQKILIGQIGEIYKNYSKVRLISNKNNSFEGEITEKETLGQVKGKGNLRVSFDFVSREKEIAEGDLVQTSTLGGIFPKGLLIGEIGEIKKSDIQPFIQAEILSPFDLGELKMVFVILDF